MQKYVFTLAFAAGAALMMAGTASADNGAAAKVATPDPVPKVHEVQPGDSLSTIADNEHLDSWRPLWDANADLSDPDVIFAGQKLTVPTGPVAERPLPAETATAQSIQQPVAAYAARPVQRYQAPRAAGNYAAGAGGILARIRQRESGGNYATNTGNGYYGAYQFNLGTWRGVGGSGLPSEASPAEQDMRAQMLYDQRGCSPWPNTCY